MAIQLHPSLAPHPGPWLRRNFVEPYGLNVSQVSDHLRVTRPAMSNLLNGKASLSPEMAIRFERAFGVSAATMLRMQSAYDLARAEEGAESIHVERIPEPA